MSRSLGKYYKSQIKLDGKRISNNQDYTKLKEEDNFLLSSDLWSTWVKCKSKDCMITNQWKGLRQNEFTIVFFLTNIITKDDRSKGTNY